jgi:hypothetical protein
VFVTSLFEGAHARGSAPLPPIEDSIVVDIDFIDDASDANDAKQTLRTVAVPDVDTTEPSRIHSLFGAVRPAREATSVFGARPRHITPVSGWAWPWPSSRKTD